MTILNDIWYIAIQDQIDATPHECDIPHFEALGANDYKAHGVYFPPRGISQEQLEQYRAGFEAAECEDARLEEEFNRGHC